MILAEQLYEVIKNQLLANSITAYSDLPPTETAYPFCMYEFTNTEIYPDWGFNKDYERITVRFNVYANEDRPQDALAILELIETIFNRTKLTFVDETEGKYLVCGCKVNDSLEIEDNPKRWKAISDYEFVCQRNI